MPKVSLRVRDSQARRVREDEGVVLPCPRCGSNEWSIDYGRGSGNLGGRVGVPVGDGEGGVRDGEETLGGEGETEARLTE